jgi:hypothetical protein
MVFVAWYFVGLLSRSLFPFQQLHFTYRFKYRNPNLSSSLKWATV